MVSQLFLEFLYLFFSKSVEEAQEETKKVEEERLVGRGQNRRRKEVILFLDVDFMQNLLRFEKKLKINGSHHVFLVFIR